MKQETLEEAVQKVANSDDFINGALFGYLWQQERMYSEEDMQSLIKIRNYFGENDNTSFEHFAYSFLDGIIKQFKKK